MQCTRVLRSQSTIHVSQAEREVSKLANKSNRGGSIKWGTTVSGDMDDCLLKLEGALDRLLRVPGSIQ